MKYPHTILYRIQIIDFVVALKYKFCNKRAGPPNIANREMAKRKELLYIQKFPMPNTKGLVFLHSLFASFNLWLERFLISSL